MKSQRDFEMNQTTEISVKVYSEITIQVTSDAIDEEIDAIPFERENEVGELPENTVDLTGQLSSAIDNLKVTEYFEG